MSLYLAKGDEIHKMTQRTDADTPALTLDRIALYNVYMFSQTVLLPLSLSLATLGAWILKITKRTGKDHKALPLGHPAIHLFDVKHLKPNSQKIIFH